MPPTPVRPPGSASSQASSATGKTGASVKHNMSSILCNIEALFTTARKGALNESSMTYLRRAINDHHRYIIIHAIKAEKSNPLLDIPESLDPSIGTPTSPPLVNAITWGMLINACEVEAIQKLADGTLEAPSFDGGALGQSTPGSSPSAGAVRPPPPGVRPQMRTAVSGTNGPLSRAGSPAGTASNAPSPGGASTISFSSNVSHPAQGSALPGMDVFRRLPPGTVMKGDELRGWASMPASDRADRMRSEPELKRRFDISVQYYRAQSRAKAAAAAAAEAQAAIGQAASGSTAPNPAASSNPPPQIQSNATVPTPNPAGNPSSQNGAPNSNAPPSQTQPTNPNPNPNPAQNRPNPNPTNSINPNPSFNLSQPPPPRSNPTSYTTQSNTTSNTDSRPNTLSNGQPIQMHSTNQNTHSVPPPPPPPIPVKKIPEEPESERRKRVYREMAGEMGNGLELELGVDDIFNDVLDKFIVDVTKSGMRLAKHRKSNKVEIKDLAFYLEKQYHMNVPGFDAIVPKLIHTPVDSEDRRRLRTVIPHLARREEAPPATGTTRKAEN